ncbi:F0F1 ATP synthase subunit B [Bacillota bacterium LX-D]|nr:F0F1 ATP synthase subunit B [Bacillota bacterium LX-D]
MIEIGFDLLIQVINFLIALWVLKKFAYKPLVNAIESRQKQIQDSLDSAAEAKVKADVLLKDYEKQLADAKAEAQEIVGRATKLGEDMKAQIVAEAKAEAEKTLEKAKAEIEGEKAKALAQIRGEISEIVITAAGKIIAKEISAKDHEKLIGQFVAGVGKVQ